MIHSCEQDSDKTQPLLAISPIDGRYANRTKALVKTFSEYGLIKTRVEVEVRYLLFLAEQKIIRVLSASETTRLNTICETFSLKDAQRIKEIESKTNHDVKAVEYFLQEQFKKNALTDVIPWIHFGLTSNDINNVAYRLLILRSVNAVLYPAIEKLWSVLSQLSSQYKNVPIIARTHGQPAVPTTFGKEIGVFASRLSQQVSKLKSIEFQAKFSGAVGNWNAVLFADPEKDWVDLSAKFLATMGLSHAELTTQIAPPEDLIEFFQTMIRINAILIDLNQDIWRYISDEWLVLKDIREQVGSSTMPQKINPIDFENSEGNLQYGNGIFETLARTLPISRLQRDLSGSTLMRNIGAGVAHSLIAIGSLIRGLEKIFLNIAKTQEALHANWTILAEAAQTLLRTEGNIQAYDKVSQLVKGKRFDANSWKTFVRALELSEVSTKLLMDLTPETYIGLASELAELSSDPISIRNA